MHESHTHDTIINLIHRSYQWLLSDIGYIWKLITFVKAINGNHEFFAKFILIHQYNVLIIIFFQHNLSIATGSTVLYPDDIFKEQKKYSNFRWSAKMGRRKRVFYHANVLLFRRTWEKLLIYTEKYATNYHSNLRTRKTFSVQNTDCCEWNKITCARVMFLLSFLFRLKHAIICTTRDITKILRDLTKVVIIRDFVWSGN